MAFIRTRVSSTRRPSRPLRIDWANPLAKGLVLAYIPGVGDLVSGSSSVARYGTATGAYWADGLLDASDDTANDAVALTLPPSSGLFSLTNEFTLAYYNNVLAAAAYANYFSVPYRASGWTSPYNALTAYRNASTSDINLQWATSSSTTQNAQFGGGGGTGEQRHVFTRAGSSCACYRNGVYISNATASGNSNIDWGEKRPVVMLNASESSLPNGGFTGSAGWRFVWNRALSAREIASFNANPWQLCAPVERALFVPPPAGSAVPTLSASTYAPGSLTSTGWRPQVTAS